MTGNEGNTDDTGTHRLKKSRFDGRGTTRRSVVKQLSVASALFGVGSTVTGSAAATPEKDDGAVEAAESGDLTNDHLSVLVTDSGMWQIDTADGENLTFPNSGTSGLTVQIDGTNYAYGTPNGTSLSQYQSQATDISADGTEATTEWEVDGVRLTQTIRLSGEAALFSLDVENTAGQDREVKLRWLFDYQVSDQDGAPIFVNGDVLTTETRYESVSFDSWQTYDQLPNPNLTGQGGVADTPTKIEFVAWEDAQNSAYDYDNFDPSKSFFTQGYTVSPQSDSAGLIYYDLGTVGPGSTESIETSYGVGSPDRDRLADVERALDNFQATATDALSTMVTQRARAHAALYSGVGQEYADNYVNYFGYRAGADGIERDDVDGEVRRKLDELLGDLEATQYTHLYEFFEAMFDAVDAGADQATMESTFSEFLEGVADEQQNGSAPSLQVGGQTIADIQSSFASEFTTLRDDAIDTLQSESPSAAEISRVIDFVDEKKSALSQRATDIEEKVDRAIDEISSGETGRVYGKRVEVDDSNGTVDSQALATGGVVLIGAKYAGVGLGFLSVSQLYYGTLGASSTTASVSGAYSGSQAASSLAWTLPSMSYWSVLQSANAATPSLTTVAEGVLSDQILQEFGLTPEQVIEEYTGVKVDLLLGIDSPVTTLASMKVDRIQDAGADLFRTVDIVDIDAPNVLGGVPSNGQVTATATVDIENTSSDPISPVIVNSESGVRSEPLLQGLIGSMDLGSTTIEADLPEIPPGETREDIDVQYTFPSGWLLGAYELQLTVSPTPVEGGTEATATDSFVTADVPSGLDSSTLLDGAISQGDSQQAALTPDPSAEQVAFNLSYPGSNLDLHLYDESDNHVGLDYQTGDFETEIPGVLVSGPDRPGISQESIRILNTDGDFECEVVAVETDGDEPFDVGATTVPSLPPTLNVYPPSTPRVESDTQAETSVTVEEVAGFAGLSDVSLSSTSLEAGDGDTIAADSVSFGQSGFDVAAGGTATVDVTVDVPDDASGTYSGEIGVTTAQSSTSVPLSVSVSSDDSGSITVTRSLSRTSVGPGEAVSVTATITSPGSGFTLNETFTPPFGTASLGDVLVDGSTVDPLVGASTADGAVVTLNGISAGQEVVIDYSVVVPQGAETGDTFDIEGTITAGDTEQTVPADTITVSGDPFSGVVADYNTDDDDDIDISELAAAASDYASGDLPISDLAEIAQVFAQS